MPRVVIGGGPSAVRMAAVLDDALLLEPSSEPGGVGRPALIEGRGVVRDRPGVRDAVRRFYGDAPELRLSGGLRANGTSWPLPFLRRDMPEMFTTARASEAFSDWTRTRARLRAQRLVGGGLEERSYRDWVVHRYGEAAYEALYEAYARRRFGDPERVNVSAARLHHGEVDEGPLIALGSSAEAGWASLLSHLDEVRTGLEIERIEVGDKRVAAVHTSAGRIAVDGELFCTAPLPVLARWLDGAIDPGVAWDMTGLTTRSRVLVQLPVEGAEALPDELHVLDEAPFFRLTRADALPGGEAGSVIAHLALEPGDSLLAGSDAGLVEAVGDAIGAHGLGTASTLGARVQRLVDYDPAWISSWHPQATRVLKALSAIGVHLAGRAALYRYCDPGQELVHAQALAANPAAAHEHARVHLDPPVRLDDTHISITRFIER